MVVFGCKHGCAHACVCAWDPLGSESRAVCVVRAALTGLGEAAHALAAGGAVPAHEHRDAAEAAGLGHGRPEVAVGAVRVRAAPRPRVAVLWLVLRAALAAVGRAPVL